MMSEPIYLYVDEEPYNEDAACGKPCGQEPMGCLQCMNDGGPVEWDEDEDYNGYWETEWNS
jgi:hypothetical protein